MGCFFASSLKLSRQPLWGWTLHLYQFLRLDKIVNGELSSSFDDSTTVFVYVTLLSISVPMRSFQGGEPSLVS